MSITSGSASVSRWAAAQGRCSQSVEGLVCAAMHAALARAGSTPMSSSLDAIYEYATFGLRE